MKGAGAVIDLAAAFDADEYPRPVQQQRRTIHALSDEIGVQPHLRFSQSRISIPSWSQFKATKSPW
jgi:hypothetical protein